MERKFKKGDAVRYRGRVYSVIAAETGVSITAEDLHSMEICTIPYFEVQHIRKPESLKASMRRLYR